MSGQINSAATGTSSSASHSKMFGPSSSHCWLNCPLSAKARALIHEPPSPYAASGTLAHELCEIKLKRYFDQMDAKEFETRLNEIQNNSLYTPAMLASSNAFLEAVDQMKREYFPSEKPNAYIEQRVSYEDICGADGFGTSDFIMIGKDTIVVADYKNGVGVPVTAEGNPQARIYAYGALHSIAIPFGYDIKKVVMAIVQPNVGPMTKAEMSVTELNEWIDSVVRPAVKKILDGSDEAVIGPWCKDGFCPNIATCLAWGEKATPILDEAASLLEKDFKKLSIEEVSDFYTKMLSIKPFLDKVEKKIEEELKSGKPIPGYKIVEGRANRSLVDADAAMKALSKASGIDENAFYKRMPLNITELTQLVGKKMLDTVGAPYFIKPQGKPVVVPLSDPRPPFSSAAADFEGVAGAAVNETKNNNNGGV